MNLDYTKLSEAVKSSFSFAEVFRKIGEPYHSRKLRKLQQAVACFGICIDHFSGNGRRGISKIPVLRKVCPICGIEFTTKKDSKEATTCSHACSNTYFRKGWRDDFTPTINTYRKFMKRTGTPWRCNRCGYDKIADVLVVHHVDRNRSNNDVGNLEVLCPTCHEEEHFTAKDGKWRKM